MSTLALAYEEAGHALVARAFGRPLELMAISPDGGFVKASEPLAGDGTPEELERSLVITFAGEIARAYAPAAPVSITAAEHASTNGGDPLIAGLLATSEIKPAEQPSDADVIEHYRERLGDEVVERARTLAIELVERLHVVGKLELIADRLYLAGVLSGDDVEALLATQAT